MPPRNFRRSKKSRRRLSGGGNLVTRAIDYASTMSESDKAFVKWYHEKNAKHHPIGYLDAKRYIRIAQYYGFMHDLKKGYEEELRIRRLKGGGKSSNDPTSKYMPYYKHDVQNIDRYDSIFRSLDASDRAFIERYEEKLEKRFAIDFIDAMRYKELMTYFY